MQYKCSESSIVIIIIIIMPWYVCGSAMHLYGILHLHHQTQVWSLLINNIEPSPVSTSLWQSILIHKHISLGGLMIWEIACGSQTKRTFNHVPSCSHLYQVARLQLQVFEAISQAGNRGDQRVQNALSILNSELVDITRVRWVSNSVESKPHTGMIFCRFRSDLQFFFANLYTFCYFLVLKVTFKF